jgi:hypothetical protein
LAHKTGASAVGSEACNITDLLCEVSVAPRPQALLTHPAAPFCDVTSGVPAEIMIIAATNPRRSRHASNLKGAGIRFSRSACSPKPVPPCASLA